MKKIILATLIILTFFDAHAQETAKTIDVGYFAPYLVQAGGKIGTSFELKNWQPKEEADSEKIHCLSFNPQIGYFVMPNVQKNLFLNAELIYKRKKVVNKLYPTASVGLGYLLTFLREEGTVNLADGNLDRIVKTIHSFVPSINLGFAKDPKKQIGYYFKVTAGRKIAIETEDSAFFGAELGLKINLKKRS